MCTVFVAHEIIHAVWKALGQAAPERSCAGWGKSIHNLTAGVAADRPFVMYHWHATPGGGAVEGRDGFNQIGHLIALGGLTLPNVEHYEQLYPVQIRQQEFRCDGGGIGRYRGGTGVHYEAEVKCEGEYSFRGEGLDTPSGFGARGGGAGCAGEMFLEPRGGAPYQPPKYDVQRFGPLIIRASSPGGGGWGDPLERDVAAVHEDVQNGLVSSSAARECYGVVLGPDGDPDPEATAGLRAERRGGAT